MTLALLLLAESAAAESNPKIVKGPWIQRVTTSSAVVRVEVAPAAAVSLSLDAAGGAPARAIDDGQVTTLHTIAVDKLSPATRYTYSVHAGSASKPAAFTTAPPDDSPAPFHFLVFGDNRTDDSAHAAVVRAMVPVPSDFIVHTGDFVENGMSASQWQTFFDIEAPLLGSRCLWSAVGNHELVDGAGVFYVKYFGPEGATKPAHLDDTFRWGNTRFFLVNGVSTFKRGNVERDWLEKVLADAANEQGLTWRIVVVHHGLWSSGPHGGNPRFRDAGLAALFRQHKIDIVFSGHDHIYQRGIGDGLPFVVSGGGGAPLYRMKRAIPESRKFEAVHHFVDVEASASMLILNAVRADGTRIERCALSKTEAGWFCGDSLSAPPPDGGPPTLGEPEKPPPQASARASRCSCDAVGARSAPIPRAGLLFAAAVIASVRRRRRY